MDLSKLKYFYHVAQEKSFTKAAASILTSQPSLSKMVKSLEEDLSVVLFERGKKGVKLTQEGQLLFKKCQFIFEDLDQVEKEFKNKKLEISGPLQFGASDNLCNYILPQILLGFWKLYPKVNVQMLSATSSQITQELVEQKLEFGIFFTRPNEEKFYSEKLGHAKFVLVCSAANERLRTPGFDLQKLQDSYFIGSRISDYTGSYPTLVMLKKLGIRPKLFFETNSQEAQKKMAMQEYGYAVVPRFMVEQELKDKKLIEIKCQRQVGSDFFLVRRKNIVLTKQAKLFENFLRAYLNKKTIHL